MTGRRFPAGCGRRDKQDGAVAGDPGITAPFAGTSAAGCHVAESGEYRYCPLEMRDRQTAVPIAIDKFTYPEVANPQYPP